jgi:hypothetical protein
MRNLLEQVSTERIESAIVQMKNPDFGKVVQLYQYKVNVEVNDLTPETASYSLAELYRELARREDVKQGAVEQIRGVLADAEKAFDNLESSN